jgi:hypothetical protein
MFFTDPASGHQHGYYDGWGSDGNFHYTGEGQRGDQRMIVGNRAIRDHDQEGRSLEGFAAHGTEATYLGEFELVDDYETEAHETGDPHTMRKVIVFKLRPLGGPPPVDLPDLPVTPSAAAAVVSVPVEEQNTERTFVTPDREPYEQERREAGLVKRYEAHLIAQGHNVSRLRVVPPGESRPLFSDLWDETTRELVEAKGSVARDRLREAVGQLVDYGRFADAKTHAVLVPERPRTDLLAFLAAAGVAVVFPEGKGWGRVEAP